MNKQEAVRAVFERSNKELQIYTSKQNGVKWLLSTYTNLNMFQYGQLKDSAGISVVHRVGHWKDYWSKGQISVDASYDEDGALLRKKIWDPNGKIQMDI